MHIRTTPLGLAGRTGYDIIQTDRALQGTGHMATVHVAGAEEVTGTHSHRRQQSPGGKRQTVLGLNLSFATY